MPETKAAVKRKPLVARVAHTGQFQQTGVRRLSDPDMQPAMTALKARITSDPGFGRSLLVRAGIVTPKGNLKKNYGG